MPEPFKIPMPPGVSRVESGPIQFGDDWPAYHLRGDNAANLAFIIQSLISRRKEIVRAAPEVAFDLMQLSAYADEIMGGVLVGDGKLSSSNGSAWLPGPPSAPGFYFHRTTFAPEATVMRVTDDGFDRLRASGLDGVVLTSLQAGEWAGPIPVPAG